MELKTAEQYLTFSVAEEEYAIDISRVVEVRVWEEASRLPNVEDFIAGVINLRGEIIPIVDTRIRFGLPEATYDLSSIIVIVKARDVSRQRTMGIIVDSVSEVFNLADYEIKLTQEVAGEITIPYIKGLVEINGKPVSLLTLDKLLGVDTIELESDKLN